MKAIFLSCVVISFIAVSSVIAGEVPDLTGTWECQIEGIVRGDNIHFPGKHSGHIQFIEGQANHIIKEQKGNRFWGYKETKSGKKEHIIGMIMTDNKSILTVDEDGQASGIIISPNEYYEFYSHSWGSGKMSVFCVKCRKKD